MTYLSQGRGRLVNFCRRWKGMMYNAVKCPVCGNTDDLVSEIRGMDTHWLCRCCDTQFTERMAEKEYKRLESTIKKNLGALVDEAILNQNTTAFYNLRSSLLKALASEYTDSEEIAEICDKMLALVPGDFLARFFKVANRGTSAEVINAINHIDDEESELLIGLAVNFVIKSLKEEYIVPTAALLERCGKRFSPEAKQELITKFETEAAKVKSGIYEVGLQRDVFLAYSSKDMASVVDILNLVESGGLTCFAAFRNLQHGRDAVQNYESALKEAMDNCSIFLFVSSENSRNFSCDAFKKEMAYIRSSEMSKHPEYRSYAQIPASYKKLRIEYRLDNTPTPIADRNMKEFFEGLTYAENHEQLLKRLADCMNSTLTAPETDAVEEKRTYDEAMIEQIVADKIKEAEKQSAARKAQETAEAERQKRLRVAAEAEEKRKEAMSSYAKRVRQNESKYNKSEEQKNNGAGRIETYRRELTEEELACVNGWVAELNKRVKLLVVIGIILFVFGGLLGLGVLAYAFFLHKNIKDIKAGKLTAKDIANIAKYAKSKK